GAESRELSIFFSDIRSFAAISEDLGASRLAEKLGAYLSAFTRIIQGPDSNGIVDKYVGDSVMAFWNAPEPVADHAYRACLAALRCRSAIDNLETTSPGTTAFRTRFGIHSGEAMVGNFGSKERLDYTCIGDAVNLAARLERINKYYSTDILISHSVNE